MFPHLLSVHSAIALLHTYYLSTYLNLGRVKMKKTFLEPTLSNYYFNI
jgi:hypothetical protein